MTQLTHYNKGINPGSVQSGDSPDSIVIGAYLPAKGSRSSGGNAAGPDVAKPPQVFIDAPELRPHKNTPWLSAYLHERYDLPLLLPPGAEDEEPVAAPDPMCRIPADLLRFHALLCGATGSGKTRLALHLLHEQMARGGSVVALDPKEETLWHIAHLARRAGVPEDDIVVLLPRNQGVGCPGWNPLDYRAIGVPAHEAVAEFVRLIEESAPSWGARLADVLKNAARLAAYHRLSLYEMVALLRQSDYRDALLRQEPHDYARFNHADRAAYGETHDYFTREFARWSAGRQAEAVDPVLNKVRSLLDIPFLRALLCAETSALDLSSLWSRPRVVLVHLDFRALGSEGTRLLAGLLSYSLFQTALRVGTGSPVPVTLSLDEMGIQERFVGGAMRDILALARSYNLRLLTACQHLGQLSPELREALLTVAFKAFFRLGPGDARPAAGFLCDGSSDSRNDEEKALSGTGAIAKLTLDLPRHGKYDPPEMEQCRHRITDPWNNEIAVSEPVWEEFARFQLAPENANRKVTAFRMLLSQTPRVYVTSPLLDGQTFELFGYLERLDPKLFDFGGPAPVILTVRFPRPKVTVLSRQSNGYGGGSSGIERERRWERTLLHLGEREAVVSTPSEGARQVLVREVRLPRVISGADGDGLDWERFVGYKNGGQSVEDVEAAWSMRRREMEHIRGGEQTPLVHQADETSSALTTRTHGTKAPIGVASPVAFSKGTQARNNRTTRLRGTAKTAGDENAPIVAEGHDGQEADTTGGRDGANHAAMNRARNAVEPEAADDGSL